MDVNDCSSSSSFSSSSSSPTSSRLPFTPSPKRKAGRKKFRETRHPVYHGVRSRGGGRKWVSEVREPGKNSRIWLGTFPTPEMAARAHDVASIALRGAASARLNFADSAEALPRARSAAPEDVRRAAVEAAKMMVDVDVVDHGPASSSEVFVDEEALFNLPGLLEDLARGLMVTPPAMHKAIDWETIELEEDGYMAGDGISLWTVDY
ncbi:dehydration-responsive element-binding protein 1F-like [Curcuma longa]|uniref:dehydration-responsive element-binding protein 1F-like n=1 Tax=Curcuma longa TaxID=136217 RepID=UPI003D9F2ADE